MKSKEILNILTRKHDMILCPDNDLKIFKIQIKFKSYEICQYLITSYVKAVVKI
jgi:hypothetical protein